MHVPLGIEDTVAKATLQLVGHRTGTLVNLYLMLVVNITQDVVTWNGVTAVLELILTDILLTNVDGLLAILLIRNGEEALRCLFLLFVVFSA